MASIKDFVSVPLEKAYRLVNFGPVVLITSTDGKAANVAPVAWVAPQRRDPPIFAIAVSTEHRTFKNIMKTGRLGINIPTVDQLELVSWAGSVSGATVNKFDHYHGELLEGEVYKSLPFIGECAAWLECKLVPSELSRDRGIIVVQAEAVRTKPGALTSDLTWNAFLFPTLHHLGGKDFLVGREVVRAEANQ